MNIAAGKGLDHPAGVDEDFVWHLQQEMVPGIGKGQYLASADQIDKVFMNADIGAGDEIQRE